MTPQQILAVISGNAQTYDYSLAGMLGAVVFLVALMAWPVSNRLRESEADLERELTVGDTDRADLTLRLAKSLEPAPITDRPHSWDY